MVKLQQRILGRGSKFGEPNGDCFATCVAMILELPQDAVPNFCDTTDWWARLQKFLRERGFCYVETQPHPDFKAGFESEVLAYVGYHVITGEGPRGGKHSGKMVADPHPSGDGLLTEELYGLFVPLNPERIVEHI